MIQKKFRCQKQYVVRKSIFMKLHSTRQSNKIWVDSLIPRILITFSQKNIPWGKNQMILLFLATIHTVAIKKGKKLSMLLPASLLLYLSFGQQSTSKKVKFLHTCNMNQIKANALYQHFNLQQHLSTMILLIV